MKNVTLIAAIFAIAQILIRIGRDDDDDDKLLKFMRTATAIASSLCSPFHVIRLFFSIKTASLVSSQLLFRAIKVSDLK